MSAPVPELLLKKRQRDQAWAAQRTTAASEARAKALAVRKQLFKRAQSYVQEYRQQVCSPSEQELGHSKERPLDFGRTGAPRSA